MAKSVALRNAMVAHFASYNGGAHFLALCTGDPGLTGANQIPGQTRAPITWPVPSGGSAPSDPVVVVVPTGGHTATHYAVMGSADGNDFLYGDPLSEPLAIPVAGNVNISVTLAA